MNSEIIFDKIESILTHSGFNFHESLSDMTGDETWTRWDDLKKQETIVSVTIKDEDAGVGNIVVGYYDEDQNRISDFTITEGTVQENDFAVLTQAVS